MARLARVVAPDLPHHVTQRGNRPQQTFFCDEDYRSNLELMAEWCGAHQVEIWEAEAKSLRPQAAHALHRLGSAGCRATGTLARVGPGRIAVPGEEQFWHFEWHTDPPNAVRETGDRERPKGGLVSQWPCTILGLGITRPRFPETSVGRSGGDPSGARRPAPNLPQQARHQNTKGHSGTAGDCN
jgi:hypothetical protein